MNKPTKIKRFFLSTSFLLFIVSCANHSKYENLLTHELRSIDNTIYLDFNPPVVYKAEITEETHQEWDNLRTKRSTYLQAKLSSIKQGIFSYAMETTLDDGSTIFIELKQNKLGKVRNVEVTGYQPETNPLISKLGMSDASSYSVPQELEESLVHTFKKSNGPSYIGLSINQGSVLEESEVFRETLQPLADIIWHQHTNIENVTVKVSKGEATIQGTTTYKNKNALVITRVLEGNITFSQNGLKRIVRLHGEGFEFVDLESALPIESEMTLRTEWSRDHTLVTIQRREYDF